MVSPQAAEGVLPELKTQNLNEFLFFGNPMAEISKFSNKKNDSKGREIFVFIYIHLYYAI